MEELLKELIAEVRGLKKYLQEAETRVALISLAEGELDKGLGKHIFFTREHIKNIYKQAKSAGLKNFTDAVENAPYSLLPESKQK